MFYPVKWLDYLRFKLRTLGLDGKAVPPVLADSAPTSIAGKLRQAVDEFERECTLPVSKKLLNTFDRLGESSHIGELNAVVFKVPVVDGEIPASVLAEMRSLDLKVTRLVVVVPHANHD